MAKPLTPEEIQLELELRAYSAGFAVGANLLKSPRHIIDVSVHLHWRQGYEDGRKAAGNAAVKYKEKLRAQAPKTG